MSRRGEAGLSLLELLVAMTLLGLVGAMVAGGVRFGTAVWERSAETGAAAIEGRLVAKLLARSLAEARPLRIRAGRREPPALFEGAPGRVVFAAPLPADAAPPGERLIEIARTEGGRLVLRHAALGERAPDLAGASEETLMAGVAALGFAYYGADPETGQARWQESWQGRDRLPALVSVRIAREGAPALAVVAAVRQRQGH